MQPEKCLHLSLDSPKNVLDDVGVSHYVWSNSDFILVDLEFIVQLHAELVGEELELPARLAKSTRSWLSIKLGP